MHRQKGSYKSVVLGVVGTIGGLAIIAIFAVVPMLAIASAGAVQ